MHRPLHIPLKSAVSPRPSPLIYGDTHSSNRFLSVPRSPVFVHRKSETHSPTYFREDVSVADGASSVVGASSIVGAASAMSAATSVISERVTSHHIKVPKRIVREEVFEKTVVIPERRVVEDIIEEDRVVHEKIVEVARPVYKERIVEVPEIEYREKIVEVPEVVVQERVHHIPKVQLVDRVQHVPKIIKTEKIVEVPEIQYHEVPVVRRVEDLQYQDEFIVKQRPVPQYVDKPIPEYRDRVQYVDVPVNVPVPVAVDLKYQYEVPEIEPVVQVRTYPLYVPRFVEVPFSRAYADTAQLQQSQALAAQLQCLNTNQVSLADADRMARTVAGSKLFSQLQMQRKSPKVLIENFQNNQVTFHNVPYYSDQRFFREMQQGQQWGWQPMSAAQMGTTTIRGRHSLSRRERRALEKRSRSVHTDVYDFWAKHYELIRNALPWNKGSAKQARIRPHKQPLMSAGHSEAAILRARNQASSTQANRNSYSRSSSTDSSYTSTSSSCSTCKNAAVSLQMLRAQQKGRQARSPPWN